MVKGTAIISDTMERTHSTEGTTLIRKLILSLQSSLMLSLALPIDIWGVENEGGDAHDQLETWKSGIMSVIRSGQRSSVSEWLL